MIDTGYIVIPFKQIYRTHVNYFIAYNYTLEIRRQSLIQDIYITYCVQTGTSSNKLFIHYNKYFRK